MNINDYPKKKLIVIDILRICNPDDIFVIRDITPSKESHGNDGDGIIYRGKKESLLNDESGHFGDIFRMEIISISGYREDYNTGYQLTVRTPVEKCTYKCTNCGSLFIPGEEVKYCTPSCSLCGDPYTEIY